MRIVQIKKITKLNYSPNKYDIEVDKDHNYFANAILVHNCRAIWTGSHLLTRTGKEVLGFPTLVEFLKKEYKNFPLDGELYSDTLGFDDIVGSVKRTKEIKERDGLYYCIYDLPIGTLSFTNRLKLLNDSIQNSDLIKKCETIQFLNDFKSASDLDLYSSQGYEGTMVRNGSSLYQHKRTSDLLKIKLWQDEEFEIIGFEQLTSKEKIRLEYWEPGAFQYADGSWYRNGQEFLEEKVGCLICKTKDGSLFGVGTGFTDEQREYYFHNPPIGKLATVKYQELTKDNIPRFPVFKCIRDYE